MYSNQKRTKIYTKILYWGLWVSMYEGSNLRKYSSSRNNQSSTLVPAVRCESLITNSLLHEILLERMTYSIVSSTGDASRSLKRSCYRYCCITAPQCLLFPSFVMTWHRWVQTYFWTRPCTDDGYQQRSDNRMHIYLKLVFGWGSMDAASSI